MHEGSERMNFRSWMNEWIINSIKDRSFQHIFHYQFQMMSQAPHPEYPVQLWFYKPSQTTLGNITCSSITSYTNHLTAIFNIYLRYSKLNKCLLSSSKRPAAETVDGLLTWKYIILVWTIRSSSSLVSHQTTTNSSSLTLPLSVEPSIKSEKNLACDIPYLTCWRCDSAM